MTVLSSQQTKLDVDMTKFSEPVSQAHRAIMQLNLAGNSHRKRKEPIYPTLQFVEIRYPEIRIGYNCPLNHHSAQIVLSAHLDAEGNIDSVQLNAGFFASTNTISWSGRAEILRLYAWHAMLQDEITASSEEKVDTAELIWPVPLSEDDAILKKGIRHIQNMIDYLQSDLGFRIELTQAIDSNFIRIMEAHPIVYRYFYMVFTPNSCSEYEVNQAFFKIILEKLDKNELDRSTWMLFIENLSLITSQLEDVQKTECLKIVRIFWQEYALQNGVWDSLCQNGKERFLLKFICHIDDLKSSGLADIDIIHHDYIRRWLKIFDDYYLKNPRELGNYEFGINLKRLVKAISL
jgi:hypothetical protein